MHLIPHIGSACQETFDDYRIQSTLPGCPAAILPPSRICPRPPSTQKQAPDLQPLPPYRPESLVFGVHSLDPSASLLPFLPESLDLAAEIEETAILRAFRGRTSGRPAVGGPVPLVSSSKSHPKNNPPPWTHVPTTPSWCYQVFKKDTYVCRSFTATPPAEKDPAPRASIYEFSDKSRQHLDHVCSNSGHLIKSQICLTYHNQNPLDGEAVKIHLDKWLKSMRRRYPDIGYLWVLEFQKRGVPHFHIFLTINPDHVAQKKIAKSWTRITKGGRLQYGWHCRAANWISWKIDSSKYLLKNYVVKIAQKDVPAHYQNVGRFWGNSRNLTPKASLITPELLANLTRKKAVPWEAPAIRHYFDKILRRYQEKQMNHDKKTCEVLNLEGKKVKWTTIERRVNKKKKKASIIRHNSELSGAFKIKNGSKIIYQLMNYITDHPPDLFSLQHAIKERVPF